MTSTLEPKFIDWRTVVYELGSLAGQLGMIPGVADEWVAGQEMTIHHAICLICELHEMASSHPQGEDQ